MAISAEFTADFSQFTRAAQGAEKSIQGVEKSTNQWGKALSQADSLLAKGGVNLNGTAKALDELSNFAGKSAKDIGAVGVAAGVAGAAMAGWEFGRAIAGWLGLDQAIGNATASLLGWGNLQEQTAGAKQDAINSAIAKGGENIRSYADAMAYLNEWQKKRLATAKEEKEAHDKTAEAMKELNSVGTTYTETLAGMDGAVVEAVKHYLEAGVSQGALATAYGLTNAQIRAVGESLKAVEAADKAWLEQMKASAAEAQLYAEILADLNTRGLEATNAANERAVATLTKQTDAVADLIIKNGLARDAYNTLRLEVDPLTQAWVTMNEKLAALDRQKQGDIDVSSLQQQIYDEYTNTLLEAAKAQDAAVAATQKAPAALDATAAATQRASAAMAQFSMILQDPTLQGFFGGGEKEAVARGFYGPGAGFTPEMAAARASGQFINTAGGFNNISNTFNVNGTAQDVARQISAEIMRSMKSGSKVASS